MTDDFNRLDVDATRIIPTPGGRKPGEPAQSGAAPPGSAYAPPPLSAQPLGERGAAAHGQGALLSLAAPLLAVMHRLRNTVSHPNPENLRTWMLGEVKAFRDATLRDERTRDASADSSFLLCTALDEAVMNTPWGANSAWQQQNLLMTYHGKVVGGDEAFEQVGERLQNPLQHRDYLELFHVCVALGFKGRYAIVEQGERKLGGIREQLYHAVMQQRGAPPAELSPHWQGISDYRNPLSNYVPLWVVAAVGLAALGGLYAWFYSSISERTSPVVEQIAAVRITAEFNDPVPRQPPPREVAPTTLPTLQQWLADDISAKNVLVIEDGDRIVVRLEGDGLFGSGSARVRPEYAAVLQRVADALNEVQGPVSVAGHTDAIPVGAASRWSSNQQLSLARADAVMASLGERVSDATRLSSQGRGPQEPIADNGTRDGRAANRRVDLYVPNQ